MYHEYKISSEFSRILKHTASIHYNVWTGDGKAREEYRKRKVTRLLVPVTKFAVSVLWNRICNIELRSVVTNVLLSKIYRPIHTMS